MKTTSYLNNPHLACLPTCHQTEPRAALPDLPTPALNLAPNSQLARTTQHSAVLLSFTKVKREGLARFSSLAGSLFLSLCLSFVLLLCIAYFISLFLALAICPFFMVAWSFALLLQGLGPQGASKTRLPGHNGEGLGFGVYALTTLTCQARFMVRTGV